MGRDERHGPQQDEEEKANSENPHAHSAYGAPKFVFGLYVWATRQIRCVKVSRRV
jgi:hypothetical protein